MSDNYDGPALAKQIMRLQAQIERLRAECDAERQEKDALANEVVCLRDALRTIANRECANEDECAALANRCLRQIDAALSGKEAA